MVGAGILLAVIGLGLWLGHSRTPSVALAPRVAARLAADGSATARGTTGGAPQASPSSVEELLSSARIAFRDPATQLPKADAPLQGSSALELYGAVLLQQPKNGEALDGVRRLQAVARQRIQNALTAGDADTAARLLAILQRAGFAPEELRALEAAVAIARPRQLAAQARSAIAAGNLTLAGQLIDQIPTVDGERSPVPELRKLLEARRLEQELAAQADQVRAAIAANQLLEPAGDNARTRFLAMRDLARTGAQTVAVQRELLAALLRRTQAALARQDFDNAQQTLTAAQEFGTKAELAETRANLEAALNGRRAAASADNVAKTERAAGSSTPESRAQPAAPVILSPKPTQDLQIEFPPAALADNIQGWAIVEFTLNPNGSTSAASIIDSSPHSIFDTEALAAVRRGRFATKDLADPAKPQRARFRINFTLADATNLGAGTKVSQATARPVTATNVAANPLQILSPKATQPLQVNYPKVALALNRTGYVVVEFMLNPDGTPSTPTVVEAVPAKVFDYEAVMAVMRARFVTTELADPLKAQRARVKISFTGS